VQALAANAAAASSVSQAAAATAAAAAVGANEGVHQGAVEGVCLAQDREAAAAAAAAAAQAVDPDAGAAGPHSPTSTALASVGNSTSPPRHPRCWHSSNQAALWSMRRQTTISWLSSQWGTHQY